MLKELKFTAFKFTEIGYFNREGHQFGDLSKILEDLKYWHSFGNKPLNETCTFDKENDPNTLGIYCYNLVSKGTDYLLTLWNESHNIDNKFLTVDGNATPEKRKIKKTKIDDNDIPGFPTYYWFNSELDVFCTISFRELNYIKQKELKKYIVNFMGSHSKKYIKFDNIKNEKNIMGYHKEGDDSELIFTTQKFNFYRMKKKSDVDYLKSNVHKIRKIVRKNKNSVKNELDNQIFKQLKKFFNLGKDDDSRVKHFDFKLEMNVNLYKEDIDSLYSDWEEISQKTTYDDIGFVFKGASTPFWISDHNVTQNFELEIEFDSETNSIDTQQLLEVILQNKDNLMEIYY